MGKSLSSQSPGMFKHQRAASFVILLFSCNLVEKPLAWRCCKSCAGKRLITFDSCTNDTHTHVDDLAFSSHQNSKGFSRGFLTD